MEVQNKKVDASPTKSFFIYMLTRDIDVRPAIVELIDNSIDGAKKIRNNTEYEGLFIKINMSQDKFIIEDNCGGIDIETAQKYAFQFGRSSERESDSSGYFTGIFGIGMKRALFKLGKKFEVSSTTRTEYFDLKVDVDEWINRPEWEFEFDKVETGMNNSNTGTKIIVEKLNTDIENKFESEMFINSLIDYIQKYRTVEAENGLDIEVNNIAIDYGKEKLLKSKDIQPYEKQIIDDSGKITIIAGITNKGEPNKAGWYIYCNGRLVHRGDILQWAEGKLTVLFPPEGFSVSNANDGSMALLVEAEGVKLLLTGDLSARYGQYAAVSADVVKAAHHGSKNGTTQAFLDESAPTAVLVSTKRENAADYLRGITDADVYSTLESGAIIIRMADGHFTIEEFEEMQ